MCWIVWVFDLDRTWEHDLPKIALDLLKWNKNRGQEWYGLSILTDIWEIITYKFQDVYDPNIYNELCAISDKIIWIIGHARYPTSWWNELGDEYVQPFSVQTRDRGFAFAFNGNIVNAPELAEKIEWETSLRFKQPVLDTSVLQEMIIKQMNDGETDTRRIQESIHDSIDGQCNMILMKDNGSFTLAKDRWGFRPVSYHNNEKTGLFTFSSESHALFKIWIDSSEIIALNTGEVVQYNSKSWKFMPGQEMNLDKENEKSRCFFETVYFADPGTTLWKENSRNHRYRLWQELALWDQNYFSRDDSVVIDVPASSKDCAKWYAENLDLPLYSWALLKDPLFDKRSFTANDADRKTILENKYIFNSNLKNKVKWKKLILIDDSIVRGSTLEYLIERLFDEYEPSEIHIRIPSPPIMGPCYYAINLKHPNELLARKFFEDPNNPHWHELDKLADHFSLDDERKVESIKYLNVDQMIRALRVNVKDMCLWCITWKYPTLWGQKKYELQLKEKIET